jgi:hypothetical protein
MSIDWTGTDLVGWLRANSTRDQRLAEAAAEPFLHGDRTGLRGLHPQILAHVRRWVPARVLREVEAKQRILELHDGPAGQPGHRRYCRVCVEVDAGLPMAWPCPTVQALAAIYQEQP